MLATMSIDGSPIRSSDGRPAKASALLVGLGMLVVACSAANVRGSPSNTSEGKVHPESDQPCQVTAPVQAPAAFRDELFGSGAAFGTDQLWVGGLGPDGLIEVPLANVRQDGTMEWKFGWWRITAGSLVISGRLLDRPGEPLTASVPDGYGQSGFQASAVQFPSPGCWEVTGSVDGATLSFVTVVRPSSR